MSALPPLLRPGALRRALAIRGYTVEEFCCETGFSRGTYSRLNRGHATQATLPRLGAWLVRTPTIAGLDEVLSAGDGPE